VIYRGDEGMRKGLFWLNDKQWSRIKPHLPTNLTGPARNDDRRIISGIVHMLQSGARWRDCPSEYGPYTTIYNRFNRWAKRGRWETIFGALALSGKESAVLSLDSTSIKAHRSASGAKGGTARKPSAARAAGAPPRSTR
jgi:transposase